MRFLLAWLVVVVLLGSCGGGNSDPPAVPGAPAVPEVQPAPPPPPAASLIRFEASFIDRFDSTQVPQRLTRLILRPLAGQADISTLPVARVEARVGLAIVGLTASNATDASGRPHYVFDFGPDAQACLVAGTSTRGNPLCAPVPIVITVTDATGFAFTKHFTCGQQSCDFGAFSDYGSTQVRFSLASTAPVSGTATRTARTGGYEDTLVPIAQTSYTGTLAAAEGDDLHFRDSVLPADGTRIVSRFDGGAGTFAESTTLVDGNRNFRPSVGLTCCGPRAASDQMVDLQFFTNGIRPEIRPTDTYTYRVRITDPASGAVIGTQADTLVGTARFTVRVRRGHVVEMEATPNVPDLQVSAGVAGGGGASSNERGTPARLRVYCCSP